MSPKDVNVLTQSAGSRIVREAGAEGLLRKVGNPIVLPAHERFIAREGFTTHGGKGLVLAPYSAGFVTVIRDVVEEYVKSIEVNRYKCRHPCYNPMLLGAFGGVMHATLSLAHLKDFLEQFANKGEFYCFFVDIGNNISVEVEAHCDRRLQLWDLHSYRVQDSPVLKDIQLIVSPVQCIT